VNTRSASASLTEELEILERRMKCQQRRRQRQRRRGKKASEKPMQKTSGMQRCIPEVF
jgi:hypothetical protein